MKTIKCKSCGSDNTCHTEVGVEEETIPDEGSISICFYCGALAKFEGDDMVPLSVEDRTDLMINYPDEWDKMIKAQEKVVKLVMLRKVIEKLEKQCAEKK
jgi:hypothetical protein